MIITVHVYYDYKFGRFLGQSLATVQNYDIWKEQRRTFDPSFGRK